MVDVLLGKAVSIRLEPPGEDSIELRLTRATHTEVYQSKRGNRDEGRWTLPALRDVLVAFSTYLGGDAQTRCYFVSTDNVESLSELAERARSAEGIDEFILKFISSNRRLRERFDELTLCWSLGADETWRRLKRLYIETSSEGKLITELDAILTGMYDGLPSAVRAALSEIADKSVHKTMNQDTLSAQLAEAGYLRIGASSRRTAQIPDNLRVRNRNFCGRRRELVDLELLFGKSGDGRATYVTLYGIGGIGKTALALEFAHAAVVRRSYPGGVWWISAEGSPIDALVSFAPVLRAYASVDMQTKLPHAEVSARAIAELVRIALQSQTERSLLVLDNISDVWERYIPGGLVDILVTTQDRALSLGVTRMVGVLTPKSTRQVAEAITGRPRDVSDRLARARVLNSHLGGLPVAVEMAAKAVQKWFQGSWGAYEQVLQVEMERLFSAPQLVGEYGRGVFAAIDLSVDKLDYVGRLLLEGAAAFAPEDIPQEWVFLAAGLASDEISVRIANAAIRELGLVTVHERHGTLAMHRLLHRRVRIRAARERSSGWGDVMARSVGVVSKWLVGVDRQFQERFELEQVDTRRPHIDQVLMNAEEAGHFPEWVLIAERLATHLQSRAEYGESMKMFRGALRVAEGLEPGRPDLVSLCLSDLAGVCCALGDDDEALGLLLRATAIDLDQPGADTSQVGLRLSNLARVYSRLERYHEALPLAERALALEVSNNGPDSPGVTNILMTLADIYRATGRPDAALVTLERALVIDEAEYGPNNPRVAENLSQLALLYQKEARYHDAYLAAERALAIDSFAYGTEHPTVALRFFGLAGILVAQGRLDEALLFVERAVAIAKSRLPADHPDLNQYLGIRDLLRGRLKKA